MKNFNYLISRGMRYCALLMMFAMETRSQGVIFSDNFDDNSINTAIWTSWGSSVVESDQIMQVRQDVTDAGGNLRSKPIPISGGGIITITRRVFIHHQESYSYDGRTHFFWAKMCFQVGSLPEFRINYDDLDYDIFSDCRALHGFYISRNGVGCPYLLSAQGDVSEAINPVWDTWFDEKITYDPVSGLLGYYINNTNQMTYSVGALPAGTSPTLTLSMDTYGWWTGHYHLMDNVIISQGSPASLSLSAAAASDPTRLGFVNVNYGVNTANASAASVSLALSSNGGASWFSADQGTLSGDYGPGIGSGNHTIAWNAAQQLPANTYNNNFRVRLVATAGGVTVTNIPAPFAVDLRGAQGGLTVAGKVLDAITRAPISGVGINLAGLNTVTLADGSYLLTDAALNSGNTLTASKAGFAAYEQTLSSPAGATRVTVPDISLQPMSGSKPVVTGVRPKYDGLFLSGASIANEYTASVDWRGQTPGKVHFYWGRTPRQHTAVNTTSGKATAQVDMAQGFHGSYTMGDNAVVVQAEDDGGQLSEPLTRNVAVIPMPTFLANANSTPAFMAGSSGNDPAFSIECTIPDGGDALSSLPIPYLQAFGLNLAFVTEFKYKLVSGEWEFRGGGKVPKLHFGSWEGDFQATIKGEGVASLKRGVTLDRLGVDLELEGEYPLLVIYIFDLVPGGQVLHLADALVVIGVDPNSIQRFSLDFIAKIELECMYNLQKTNWDPMLLTPKVGLKGSYIPDLYVAKLEMSLGGTVNFPVELAMPPVFHDATGEAFFSIKAYVFGFKSFEGKYILYNGPIPHILGDTVVAGTPGISSTLGDGWKVIPVKTKDSGSIVRNELRRGPEGFAVASSDALQSRVSAGAQTVSALEAFRNMKQAPQHFKEAKAISTKRVVGLPEMSQVELPIITNAFPFSEPCLAGYGQELMLLWVADNANTNDLQYADIHYSYFNGTDWSAPAAIVTDTRADFAPRVAFDGNGDAVAVWQKVTDPDFTNADLSAMAAEMEIVWSRWDRTAGTWSTPVALTTNTCYDGSPLLAGPLTNGDLLVTWTKNEANLLMGTGTVGAAENDTVLCSRWNAAAHSWGSPETIVSKLAYRLSQSLAAVSNRAVYAWTTDADGVLTNEADQEVYYRFWVDDVWGPVTRLTTDTVADKNVRAAVAPTLSTAGNAVMSEGFETGDFSHWPWAIEGNAAWTVQNSTVYTGTLAAASGGIGDNQSSTMKVDVSCTSGTVSFAYKVSSEAGWDYLQFCIDGQQQGAWSGSAEWATVSYPLSSGTHTLKWTYSKDATVSSGSDKAWVDAISIPGGIPSGVYLVWQRGQNLVFDKDFANQPRLARPDSTTAGFADYAMTYGPQGNMVLLWQEITTNGSDAHYSVYDPISDTWSKDVALFNDAPIEHSFAPVWDSAGQLNFAYNKVEMIMTNETFDLEGGGSVTVSNVPQQGRVDVAVAVRRLIADVAIQPGDFTVQGANYLPGDAVTLSAKLRNVGDIAVSNAAVAFYHGDPATGGTLITNVTWEGWLEGAATNAVLTTLWVVPEPATNRTVYAIANPGKAFTEFTANNNTQNVSIGGADLSVALISATAETNGSMRVIAQVQNLGAPGATNTTLALRRQGQGGTPLATVEVPALEPGRLAQVALDLPTGTQPEGEAFYTLQADDAITVADINTNNNATTFAVNLWIDSDGDGIPNWWMTQYFGHATGQAGDKSRGEDDADGDGMSNYAEWRAGTDPHDVRSFLVVQDVASLGTNTLSGGFLLSWGSISNKFYTIDRATDLVNGIGFAPIQQHIVATPLVNTYQDTSVTTNAGPFFYRIEVE